MTTDLDLGLRHDDDRPRMSRRRARLRRLGRFGVLLVVLLVLVGIVGVGLAGVRRLSRALAVQDYSGTGSGSTVIQVRTGDSSSDIADTLAAYHVVKSSEAFVRAATGDPRALAIQPGYYRLHEHMSGAAALALLLNPASKVSSRVLIPEGTPLPTALQLISAGARIPLPQLQQVAAHPAQLALPSACGGQLEGCVFPATYLFPPGTSAKDALAQMVARFNQAAQDVGLASGAKALHRTPYQVLIVASLLEKEAGLEADFPKVARVVYNRLDKKMPLQFDSTVNYALKHRKGHLSNADTRIRSPYNTYLHKGLPPTPIDSPGEVALRAALHPTKGGWLYFVTMDKAGHTAFATTYPQFQQLRRRSTVVP